MYKQKHLIDKSYFIDFQYQNTLFNGTNNKGSSEDLLLKIDPGSEDQDVILVSINKPKKIHSPTKKHILLILLRPCGITLTHDCIFVNSSSSSPKVRNTYSNM